MKLHEYQAKELLKKQGVNVPEGQIAFSADEARNIAESYGDTVVIKAQVHVGGRGKAGGVKLAKNPEEAFAAAQKILGMDIKGLTVKKVLVAKAVDIATEYYAGITLDRSTQRATLMVSKEGGVEIEEVAKENPAAIVRYPIDPDRGLRRFEAREVVRQAGLTGPINALADTLVRLYHAYLAYDCTLAEINPLVISSQGEVVAADAKIDLDDNSLFRHPDLRELRELEVEHPLEVEAAGYGFAYVKLEGNIGIIGNGAGLVMYTLDLVRRVGGQAANFLDIGGGAKAEVVYNSLKLVQKDPEVRGIFINIFGGITRADEVARGVLRVMAEGGLNKPLVMRVAGTAEEEAKALLADSGVRMFPSSTEAAASIVAEVNK